MDLFEAEPEEQEAQLGGGAGEDDEPLRVNQSYANRFEQRKKKQVHRRAGRCWRWALQHCMGHAVALRHE
jgi:hypothetical protein